ncbi:MAG: 4Fe-4S dicluster domain-containing protein [Coriobacteriales bacterium]|nr:4Fe-4S dicluster domain-containing protein [Coriobacteriales bacterium]
MSTLTKDQLPQLLAALSESATVYVPAEIDGISKFAPYGSAGTGEPRFDLVNTMLPPKDLLFPQSEKMYRYGIDAEGQPFINSICESTDVVLFGIRPCDVRSIECMDDVFLTKGFADENYQARRQHLLTVAIGCTAPAETCFCDSMGLSPVQAPAADILLNETADGRAWQITAQTEKGQQALAAAGFSADSSESTAAEVSCSLKVNTQGLAAKLDAMYDHPLWEQTARKCLTCGTCTYVCPTCHCFDISQENRMREGTRFRSWDSCMFFAYTEMAGNHNPRADKMPRVRQRFLHKLCFFEQRYGKTLCVGCGRCVEKCPVALDITVLIDQLNAAEPVQPAGEGE